MTHDRPTIRLHAHDAVAPEALTPLLLGIEEEGVPVEVHRHGQLNPLTLAHEAAVASRLGVGIGVALDFVVITTEKLPESRPYIAEFLGRSTARDRIVGADAARIVKRSPLRGSTCKH